MMDALTIKGLCKAYPAFRLEEVSFSLPQGSIMGFIGVNGAGKTTTLKSLMGYVRADAGEIAVLGRNFSQGDAELREQIGFVSGGVDYFPRKRLKAIAATTRAFYPKWDEAAYQSCLRRFKLDENKRVKELSAGMKVKFQLALALSHRARLLILDEPTSGLDPVSRDDLLELFLTLCEEDGVSILFSTHITSDLEKCAQYITYIQSGKILFSTGRTELLERYRVVSGTPEQFDEATLAKLIGVKKHLDSVTGLIEVEDAPLFAGCAVTDATLEDIMVYSERRAQK